MSQKEVNTSLPSNFFDRPNESLQSVERPRKKAKTEKEPTVNNSVDNNLTSVTTVRTIAANRSIKSSIIGLSNKMISSESNIDENVEENKLDKYMEEKAMREEVEEVSEQIDLLNHIDQLKKKKEQLITHKSKQIHSNKKNTKMKQKEENEEWNEDDEQLFDMDWKKKQIRKAHR